MGKIEDDAATRLAHGSAHDAEQGHTTPRRGHAGGELLSWGGKKGRIARRAAAAVLGSMATIALVLIFTDLEWRELLRLINWPRVVAAVDQVNPAILVPLMAILPVFGFPISLIYLVAGARFGPLWGGVVVALITSVHLLVSHVIGRSVLRRPLQRFIEKRHTRLPEIQEDEETMVALIIALVPGLPYVVRLYLPVLANIRLRNYFWVCLGVYVARSYVAILFGDLSTNPSGRGLLILLGVDVLKVLICGFVIWRLRIHHRRHHPAPAAESGAKG